jgi:ribose 5-phosphate isomerase A
VVIADSSKVVEALHAPVPLELLAFGLTSTLARLAPCAVRGVAPSPDGGVIADYWGEVHEPGVVAGLLSATPGVVEHGLFAPALVSEVYVGVGHSVRQIVVGSKHE